MLSATVAAKGTAPPTRSIIARTEAGRVIAVGRAGAGRCDPVQRHACGSLPHRVRYSLANHRRAQAPRRGVGPLRSDKDSLTPPDTAPHARVASRVIAHCDTVWPGGTILKGAALLPLSLPFCARFPHAPRPLRPCFLLDLNAQLLYAMLLLPAGDAARHVTEASTVEVPYCLRPVLLPPLLSLCALAVRTRSGHCFAVRGNAIQGKKRLHIRIGWAWFPVCVPFLNCCAISCVGMRGGRRC